MPVFTSAEKHVATSGDVTAGYAEVLIDLGSGRHKIMQLDFGNDRRSFCAVMVGWKRGDFRRSIDTGVTVPTGAGSLDSNFNWHGDLKLPPDARQIFARLYNPVAGEVYELFVVAEVDPRG